MSRRERIRKHLGVGFPVPTFKELQHPFDDRPLEKWSKQWSEEGDPLSFLRFIPDPLLDFERRWLLEPNG